MPLKTIFAQMHSEITINSLSNHENSDLPLVAICFGNCQCVGYIEAILIGKFYLYKASQSYYHSYVFNNFVQLDLTCHLHAKVHKPTNIFDLHESILNFEKVMPFQWSLVC